MAHKTKQIYCPDLTDAQVIAELQKTTVFNNARVAFSSWSARIELASSQAKSLDPITMRRMEFAAVREIASMVGGNAELNLFKKKEE